MLGQAIEERKDIITGLALVLLLRLNAQTSEGVRALPAKDSLRGEWQNIWLQLFRDQHTFGEENNGKNAQQHGADPKAAFELGALLLVGFLTPLAAAGDTKKAKAKVQDILFEEQFERLEEIAFQQRARRGMLSVLCPEVPP